MKKKKSKVSLLLALVLALMLCTLAGCKANQPVESEQPSDNPEVSQEPNVGPNMDNTKLVLGTADEELLQNATIVQAQVRVTVDENNPLLIPAGSLPRDTLLEVPITYNGVSYELLFFNPGTDYCLALNKCMRCAPAEDARFMLITSSTYGRVLVCKDCGTMLSNELFTRGYTGEGNECSIITIDSSDYGYSTLGEIGEGWNLKQYPWLTKDGIGYGVPPIDMAEFSEWRALIISAADLDKYIEALNSGVPVAHETPPVIDQPVLNTPPDGEVIDDTESNEGDTSSASGAGGSASS